MIDNEKTFKDFFTKTMKELGFKKTSGSWHKENDDIHFLVNLQKSNYGANYYINLGIFLKMISDGNYREEKSHLRTRVESLVFNDECEIIDALNLEKTMVEEQRLLVLEKILKGRVMEFFESNSSREKIENNYKSGQFKKILVRKELYNLLNI